MTSSPSNTPARPHRSHVIVRCWRAGRNRVRVIVRGNRIWQVVTDAILIAAAWWLAFDLRFDSGLPAIYERTMWKTIGVVVAIKLGVFIVSNMYGKWWRYMSVKDMEGVLRSVIAASVGAIAYVYLVQPLGFVHLPRSVAVLDFAITLFLIAGVRLAARSFFERPGLRGNAPGNGETRRVLVVGAGEAGRLLIREMVRQNLGMTPVGLLDDDDRKQHMRLDGVLVLGTSAQLPKIVAEEIVDEVVIAMPSAGGEKIQRVVELARAAGAQVRILPALSELVMGDMQNLTGRLREVSVEDVLGREPIRIDLRQIAGFLTDQVVLITGAGGSIGSELVRQIAQLAPAKLVLVDNGENALFMIDGELRNEREFDRIVSVVADIGHAERMRAVFAEHKPTVVFHAAAFKHVPMMELNPVEAVRNNAFGTRTICEVAEKAGVERFVLISTDKAVEPCTVMGQSKALAEWIVQGFAARSFHTRFMAVRFGNVLGSNGSVVPIFRRQIERGGPVTVTHEEMVRFFMTIPEAVQLVIQAGAIGEGGEVFVLDMGKPVRIMDLARNMIELSGREVGSDIEIKVTGIRPGEKLFEDLFAGDEEPEKTSHEKIWRAACSYDLDADWLLDELEGLRDLIDGSQPEVLAERLQALIQPRIDAGARNLPA